MDANGIKWHQTAHVMFCIECRAYGIDSHFASTKGCFVCLDYALLCHWGQKKNIACPTAQEPGARHRAKGETKQRREVAEKSSCMFLLTSKSLGTECLNLLEFASLVLLQRTSLMSAFGAATAFWALVAGIFLLFVHVVRVSNSVLSIPRLSWITGLWAVRTPLRTKYLQMSPVCPNSPVNPSHVYHL